MKKNKLYLYGAISLIIIAIAVILLCLGRNRDAGIAEDEAPEPTMYGIPYLQYERSDAVVCSGESLSVLLGQHGVSAQRIDRFVRCCPVFDPRTIRAGHEYHMFFTRDSIPSLDWFVYRCNRIDYMVLDLRGDSIVACPFQKDVVTVRQRHSGQITSSLWNCMVEGGMSPGLAMELSDIYAWSIDFFGLQKGDSFTVVYDEQFVDSLSVGTGRIWGAQFTHNGKTYNAIPFKQNGKIEYWDENGNSLRKNLLKAPLKFSRITSKFTNARFHPVLKYYRPHHGVDYAAPSGTPVNSVADGTVTYCGWSGGGGNTIKVKHAKGLVSSYMHLRGYAKGVRNGSHVSQGQLIGYVGSTGLSTGPHLDFRLYKNGKAINPLSVPTEPAEPIAKANLDAFAAVRERIMAEVAGTLADSLRITSLDSLYIVRPGAPDSLSRATASASVR